MTGLDLLEDEARKSKLAAQQAVNARERYERYERAIERLLQDVRDRNRRAATRPFPHLSGFVL
jgi:hypothetical protein